MPRFGRMIPAFGTLQSFNANVKQIGANALSKASFGDAHDRIMGSMFNERDATLTDEPACRVFYRSLVYPTALVWKPMCGVGHAAVFIAHSANRSDDTTRYASLFPGRDVDTGMNGAGPESILPGRKNEAKFNSFIQDCRSEGNGEGGFRLPEYVIPLQTLHRADMIAAWIAIRSKADMHYRMMRKNCSTIAARVIRAGAGHGSHDFVAHKAWWTPYDVVTLAKALA